MKTNQFWNYLGIVLIISLVMGIFIHFNSIMLRFGLISESTGVSTRDLRPGIVISQVLISSFVAFLTFIINYFILRPLDGNYHLNAKRISIAILLTIVSVTILTDAFFSVKHLIYNEPDQNRFNLIYSLRDLLIVTVVISGIIFIKTIYDKQSVKIENEKLKNEKLLGQYESLKNQMSPHFLFNSLTALRELIDQDAKDAKLYISHLSLVLRYTLSSIDAQSKSLYEELEVAESYLHLVKIRYGTSLKVETSVDDRYKNFRLPPLAIQILIENAIKHNEISNKNPFTIKIGTTADQNLVVTNPIQARVSKEFSSGIGLSNLSKQYQYLAGKEITISNKNNEFRVELPLINPSKNEGFNS
jgi:sensor histidine kinase YesM